MDWFYLISASDIPYFAYFFKHINSSIFEWFGYAGTTAGMILGESAYYLSIGLFLLFLAGFVVWLIYLARYFHHRSLTISAPFPYWKRGRGGSDRCLLNRTLHLWNPGAYRL